MRLQAGIIVVIVGAIAIWMATRGGEPLPPDLVAGRDQLVAQAGVLVAEFTSGSESPVRVATRIDGDNFIFAWQGTDMIQTEAGQFFELLPGCWVEYPAVQESPLIPALTVAPALRSAPRLVTLGESRYSYFYQWDPPRFIGVTEDLHALDRGLITATTSSGAPGGPNGIFTIREADPDWAAEARAIVAGLQPSESTTLRLRYRPVQGVPGVRTAIIARDCPFLATGRDETAIEFGGSGEALLQSVAAVDLPYDATAPLNPGPVRLRSGLTFVVPETPSMVWEIVSCRATDWFDC